MASKVKVNTVETESGSTLTLGKSGDTVTLASGASQSGFGRTGTVDWDTTPKTANFTAVSGDGFFVNTTSGAITATLPAGSAGAIVAFADYANTFDTNNLTISPDGTDKIGGTNADAIVSTEGASTTFVYVDSTQGWKQVNDATLNTVGENFITATGGTITTDGNFKVHTFTGPGTFCVSQIATLPANNEVDYLVVGGGGSGGHRNPGNANGGGGAGGFRFSASGTYTIPCSAPGYPLRNPTGLTVTATSFPITVGAGGAGIPGPANPGIKGNSGANSIFSTITSAGGGAGGAGGGGVEDGLSGGSGGGSGGGEPGGSNIASGNTPPVSPPQGNNGGRGGATSPDGAAGGGGGATQAGTNAANAQSGPGGDGAGVPTAFGPSNGVANPSPDAFRYYAGGGSGSGRPDTTTGTAGLGGGASAAVNATANTGGGSGGGTADAGDGSGNGGSGIVVIRYKFQ